MVFIMGAIVAQTMQPEESTGVSWFVFAPLVSLRVFTRNANAQRKSEDAKKHQLATLPNPSRTITSSAKLFASTTC
jgi:hypothetical protein